VRELRFEPFGNWLVVVLGNLLSVLSGRAAKLFSLKLERKARGRGERNLAVNLDVVFPSWRLGSFRAANSILSIFMFLAPLALL